MLNMKQLSQGYLEKVVPHPDCCVDRCSKSSSRKLSGLRFRSLSRFIGTPSALHSGRSRHFFEIPSIPEGNVLSGEIPGNKLKLITAWIEIHQEELMADWKLAVEGQQPFKIEPLR
ncbi:DUF4160 domain-containing protein [Chlorobium phaeobacteroides]|uniref:DUF4160 domain-containing protein n=1 Tax=Chlorobium phaeobacteroides TaxID=1096 RepID=UPI00295281BC|nr:DUF4160 domain-containing protein [Chlorobium phaeobacteroides]